MKKLLLTNLFTLTVLLTSAQQKVKDGTVNGGNLPDRDAVLELESSSKGLLHSRVALRLTSDAFPLSAHTAGMMVYNTSTQNDVVPGIYYNDGTKWVLAKGSISQGNAVLVQSMPGTTGTPGTPGQPGGPGAGVTIVINDSGTYVYNAANNSWTNINGTNGAPGTNGANGANGVSVTATVIDASGHLQVTLSNGTTIDAGIVKGADGINGKDGIDGKDGIGVTATNIDASGRLHITLSNGTIIDAGIVKGADGINGKDGIDGKDGIGVTATNIDASGRLHITLSNGTIIDAGIVKGADGVNGKDGIDGKDGIGVTATNIDASGHLQVTLSNGTTIDAGIVKGADGINGKDGIDGKDGIGVTATNIDASGRLHITLSNGTIIDAGIVKGADGVNGKDGIDGKDGIGVTATNIDASGRLHITLSNGTIIDAGMVKGDAGPAGATGDTGLPGATGPAGPAGNDGNDGLSAYDLWLISNPGQTLTDFFASLKGDPGPAGGIGLISDGTNTTVTGAGTTGDPYKINTTIVSTDASNLITAGTDGGAKLLASALPAPENIYNANGTLTGFRTLTMNGNGLRIADNNTATEFQGGAFVFLNNYAAGGRAALGLRAGPSQGDFFLDDGSTLRVVAGSAAVPIALDLGTYAAPITFTTNNTQKAVITADGNLGIGTETPYSTLQVSGSVAAAIKVLEKDISLTEYTLTDKDYTLILTGTTTDPTPSVTIKFPQASTCPGRIYVIINNISESGGGSIIPQTFSSFDGSTAELNPISGTAVPSATVSPDLTSTGTGSIRLSNQRTTWQSDGNKWWIIGL